MRIKKGISLVLALVMTLLPAMAEESNRLVFAGDEQIAYIEEDGHMVILDGVTYLGMKQFSSFSITGVSIPDSVTSIGQGAFSGCEMLTDVTIPGTVATVGKSAFDGCASLTEVTLLDGVKTLGEYAFADCESLTTVTIPSSVTLVEEGAFYRCSSLTDVYYDGSPEDWLEIDDRGGGIGFWSDAVIHYASLGDEGFDIQDGILSGYYGTEVKIKIPGSVTTIYELGAQDDLTDVTIPASVAAVSTEAFHGCPKLKSIQVAAENPDYTSQDGVLFSKDGTELVRYPSGREGSYTVPRGVTTIRKEAFYKCNGLTAVTIPEGVTTMADAFSQCDGLTEVNIPGSVTNMKNSFYACENLTKATISEGVTSIGERAFELCKKLTSVTIPRSVTKIEMAAFGQCSALKRVTYGGIEEEWDQINISSVSNERLSRAAFQFGNAAVTPTPEETPKPWDADQSEDPLTPEPRPAVKDKDFVVKDGVLTEYVGSGKEVVIPKGVTSIGSYAFEGKYDLTSVTIPDGVVKIGKEAFKSCRGLTSVTIPDSVTTIGDEAFCYCSQLADVTIPDSVTTIGESAFYDCERLTSVTIPADVTAIGASVFYGCKRLTDVTILSGVVEIGNYAFGYYHDNDDLTVYGYAGSDVEEYCKRRSITFAPLGDASIAYASTQAVELDGRPVTFGCYALKDAAGNMTNYIKLRDLALLLNSTAAQFQVGWDNEVIILTQMAYTPNGTELATPFTGDRTYQKATGDTRVDGRTVRLSAFILNDDQGGGYTYYQLRDLGQALGFNVGWSSRRGIFVETDRLYDPSN